MPARSAWKTRAISVRYDGVRVTSLPTARTNLINAVVAKQPAPVIKSTAALLAKSLQVPWKKSGLLNGVVCFSTYLRRDENQHGYAQRQRRLVRMRGQQTQPLTFWIRLMIFLHRRSKLYMLIILLRLYRECVKIQSLSQAEKNSSRNNHPLIYLKWLRLCHKASNLSSKFPVIKKVHLLKKAAC